MKAEYVKTIQRLSRQEKFKTLLTKLVGWIHMGEIQIPDLLFNCTSGNHLPIPSFLLNKIGTYYNRGKCGLRINYHNAFLFFKCSAELGNPYSCGSCAQYYFDGRAPEGRQLMLAEYYCRKALASGELRFILLMAEILYSKNEWKNVINCIHKVATLLRRSVGESSFQYNGEVLKLLLRARELEKLCLVQLLCQHIKYNTSEVELDHNGESNSSRLESNEALSSPRNMTINTASPVSPTLSNRIQPSPLYKLVMSNDKKSPIKSPFKPAEQSTVTTDTVKNSSKSESYLSLPGWSRISSRLDGFDLNACSEFTHRVSLLELETVALKSACATAEKHVLAADTLGRHLTAADSLSAHHRLQEYDALYNQHRQLTDFSLLQWKRYINIEEHTLRRQLLVEKAFFNPLLTGSCHPTVSKLGLALLNCRLRDDIDHHLSSEASHQQKAIMLPTKLVLSDFCGNDGNAIPTARTVIMAERSLLETAYSTYGDLNLASDKAKSYPILNNTLVTFEDTSDDNDNIDTAGRITYQDEDQAGEDCRLVTGWSQVSLQRSRRHQRRVSFGTPKRSNSASSQREGWDSSNLSNYDSSYRSRYLKIHSPDYSSPFKEATTNTIESSVYSTPTHHMVRRDSSPSPAMRMSNHIRRHSSSSILESSSHFQANSDCGTVLPSLEMNCELPGIVVDVNNNEESQGLTYPEDVYIGNALVRCRYKIELHLLRLEDDYLVQGFSDDPSYLIGTLNRISMAGAEPSYSDSEGHLADLFISFLRDGQPFSVHDVRRHVNGNASDEDVAFLNTLSYHFLVKRLVRWVLPSQCKERLRSDADGSTLTREVSEDKLVKNEKNISVNKEDVIVSEEYSVVELPLASGLARALQLISAGHLTFAELISPDSTYSIMHYCSPTRGELGTGKRVKEEFPCCKCCYRHTVSVSTTVSKSAERVFDDMIGFETLRKKIIAINNLYHKALLFGGRSYQRHRLGESFVDSSHTFEDFSAHINYWKRHPKGECLPTLLALMGELVDVYGKIGNESENFDSSNKHLLLYEDFTLGRIYENLRRNV